MGNGIRKKKKTSPTIESNKIKKSGNANNFIPIEEDINLANSLEERS